MNKELKTCGFGKKRKIVNFGSSYESFYKKGTNTIMTPGVKKCLNIIYGPKNEPNIQNSLGFGSSIDSDIKYLKK
jgi:hypothetical protein